MFLQTSDNCEVVQLNNEINPSFLTDSCCNSNFLIDDGTPFSGPAALLPLKQYYTSFDGTYIYISINSKRYALLIACPLEYTFNK